MTIIVKPKVYDGSQDPREVHDHDRNMKAVKPSCIFIKGKSQNHVIFVLKWIKTISFSMTERTIA